MKQVFLIACCALSTACANMKVEPTNRPDKTNGIIYYQPMPYLVISKATKGDSTQISSSVIMLPDQRRARKITWSTGLFGSIKPSVELKDGWMLAGVKSEESQGFDSIVSALIKAEGFMSSDHEPGIYPLRWNSEQGGWSVDWESSITGPL